ncbi:3-hydroxyacyl-CoA dehydrogenase NAD-binding domain-containing protein [Ovoidimarina sediminis]|uniref:3-hydroxyacyl-CoA dehydrogenase NAD-binding domain-containing protein n=1 Tax=Ovoidimarina sediminis TaxID=3079856 RepID=UPI002912286C|nr:3-hydroxyacyl-CoA dehydrogenase NAD-binding domain-containing protein [Rhodophyticola sp. MJ-SS7]MDU8944131.1 3-hydroxyacyl-CoA dehydrogenase NAD-binding domain-containing protein [Rhodophyticola sp. MJ-SS7]
MAIRMTRDGGVAIVTIDVPPVNAISQAVRRGLLEAVEASAADPEVTSVVLAGARLTFSEGEDLCDLEHAPDDPLLGEVLRRIETSGTPWIAAVQGKALGAGLDLAMACHRRIAVSSAVLGLPEVSLGLIPGAGGTVRLPRLIALDRALEMIVTGKPMGAEDACEAGLIDRVVSGDLLSAATAMAREAAAPVPTLARPVCPESAPGAFEDAAKRAVSRAKGQAAPVAAVEALRQARDLPAEEALVRERRLFLALRGGEEARALRHINLAERATRRIDRLDGVAPHPVRHVGVIGGGTMGAGIAAACLLAGVPVTMVERGADAARAGQGRVHDILDGSLKRGKLTPESHAERLAAFTATDEFDALAPADLVVEAAFEDMAVKQEIFARLGRVVRPNAVLATNTSYLDVGAIAAQTGRPGRVIGLHFFAPAHIMKLLEVVAPDGLDDRALATGVAFARRLGKIPVLAGVCDGFIANRLMSAYRREAEYMLEDGAFPWQIDAAMEAYGFPMGLFRVQDLSGLDISWAMRKRQAASRDPAQRYVRIGDLLCEAGHFGRKTGRGYYAYDDAGTARPSPETAALIEAESARKCIARRAFTEGEIMDRLLEVMRTEGQRILAEGIARSAEDIDVVMVNAFGFPRWKGGPMFAAARQAGGAASGSGHQL